MCLNRKCMVLFLLTGLLSGCSAGFLGLAPVGDRRDYTEARDLYANGHYEAAIHKLTEYIYKTKNVNRREARAYRLLGKSYEQLNFPDKSLEIYLEALEFHPKDVPLLLEAAHLYQQTGLTNRSVEIYEQVLALDEDNTDALAGQALNYMTMGFDSKARRFYDRLFALNPAASAQHRAEYALSFLHQRKYGPAFTNISLALEKEPANPDFLLISAQACYGLGHYERALQQLQSARELAPQRTDLMAYQALWLHQQGQYDASNKVARELAALRPDSSLALFIQGLNQKASGQTRTAQKTWQRITRQDSSSFTGRVAAALTH